MRERYLFEMIVPGSERESKCAPALEPAEEIQKKTLETLAQEAQECRRCSLCQSARQVVFGEGNPEAQLMFVGEGPGADEDVQGRPFVGKAGELLNKILAAAEISRDEVYIANVVKCRPPDNRAPHKDEAETCLDHLLAQIQMIKPKIIVALGATSTQALLGPGTRSTTMRGRWHDFNGIQVMPTYHPAALLRDPSKKRQVWQDIQEVRDAYRQLK